MNYLASAEMSPLRLAFFLGIFTAIASWEVLLPRRPLRLPRSWRWRVNIAITLLNTAGIALLLPMGTTGIALLAETRGWGLMNRLHFPLWSSLAISLILLDLAVYLQHVAFHRIPLLWRIHRMHHTDLDLDVTSGTRFHPLEILLSLFYKGTVIIILGTPTSAALTFEIILNGTSMFNHGNIYISSRWDRLLRSMIVTPDMHRVHHSTILRETDSNFGFSLSLWDRFLGTYRDQPMKGHLKMRIGLKEFQGHQRPSLTGLLLLPFVRGKD